MSTYDKILNIVKDISEEDQWKIVNLNSEGQEKEGYYGYGEEFDLDYYCTKVILNHVLTLSLPEHLTSIFSKIDKIY